MAYSPFEKTLIDNYMNVNYPDPAGDDMEDVQLAAGPTPVVSDAGAAFGVYPSAGRRRPEAQSDIGGRIIPSVPDVLAGGARGAAIAAGGLGGDIQKLGRFIKALADDNQGGGFVDKLGRAAAAMGESPTLLPSSEDLDKAGYTIPGTGIKLPPLPAAVPAGTSALGLTPEQRETAAAGGQFVGEIVGDPLVMAKGAMAAGKAAVSAGKMLAPTAGRMAGEMLQRQGLTPNIVQPGPNIVSTRLPTAVKATEDPLANRLVIDLQATKLDPKAFAHNVSLVRQYPNVLTRAKTPDRVAEDFITQVKDNLLYLHDQVPDATRQRSRLWYDGARTIADRFSSDYGVPDQAVAGVLAVLSPQKDWFMNVSLGQRVLDIMGAQQSTRWDSSMDDMASIIWKKEKYAPMLASIKGKTLGEISDPGLQAMWLRTYDQAKNPKSHQIVSPEGNFMGTRMNADGKTPTGTSWGSLNEIGKAVAILRDPRREVISTNLGDAHKVRNFYNNIYAPNDPAGPVTIDTHAVAAGLLRPLSGNSREVKHNFGGGPKGERGTADSDITGVKGTYGLYAEAYRRAAQERGILPREMQSITWEAVRGLYPDTFKSQAKNVQQIDDIWLQYRNRQLSLEEARDAVIRSAGGIRPPEWEAAGLRRATTPEIQPAGNTGELPGSGVPGRGARRSGREQSPRGNTSSITGGQQASQEGAN